MCHTKLLLKDKCVLVYNGTKPTIFLYISSNKTITLSSPHELLRYLPNHQILFQPLIVGQHLLSICNLDYIIV